MRRNRRMDDQRIGTDRDIDGRREILADVIGRGFVDRDSKRKATRRVEERIAVWRRANYGLAADNAGRARPILHNERLIPALAEFLRQHSGHHVDAATRGDRNDDVDWPIGIIGLHRCRVQDWEKEAQKEGEDTHRPQLALSAMDLIRSTSTMQVKS